MTHLQIKAQYDAPIERVFGLMTDFARYPEWNVTYTEIKEVVGPPDKVGTRIHSVMRFLGRTMEGWGEIRYGLSEAIWSEQLFEDDGSGYWNPLVDDGAALRLAAKLYLWDAIRMAHRLVGAPGCADIYAATRYAIVEAAALIPSNSGGLNRCDPTIAMAG